MIINTSKLSRLKLILITIATVLFFNGCGEKSETESFIIDKQPQQVSERVIKDTLIPADSLVISEVFDVLNASRIDVDEHHLYLGSSRNEEGVTIINKQSLDYLFTISPDEGRGPGEVTGIGSRLNCLTMQVRARLL